MRIAEIWRYPVKSMAGESLRSVRLGPGGVEGDRVVHVATADGRVVTARLRPALLGLHATLGPDGEPLVDGRPWRAPDVARKVRRAAGGEARLVRHDGLDRFDVLPLLVATDGAIREFGHDGRRLRPNIVIGGVPGLEERLWEGRRLRLGDCVIAARDLRARCVMTTFDPDTQAQDPVILRGIVERFGGTLALNCEVVRGGTLTVGDPVSLVDESGTGG